MPIILGALIIIADQLVKLWAANSLSTSGMSVIDGVFRFTYCENTGAAWSILNDSTLFLTILSGVLSAAILYIVIRYYKKMHTMLRFELILILAGSVGNLIDRAALGYVRDMFDFCLINFPVFNVADSAICIGAILLLLDVAFFKSKTLFDELENQYLSKKAARKTGNKNTESGGDTDA